MVLPKSRLARRSWLFGLAALAVYCGMIFQTLAELQEIAGMPAFDMRPMGYSVHEAHEFLTALGDRGRYVYLSRQLILDTLYPALLALTLTNVYLLINSGGWMTKVTRIGIWMSWSVAAADYLENAGIAAMLYRWPDVPAGLVQASSVVTVVKSVLTMVCVSLLLALVIGRCLIWALRR